VTPSQTFHDHIKELRRRLMLVILAIGISGGIAFWLYRPILVQLQRPLGQTLFYTSPAGSFNFIMKLSLLIGFFVALPVAIYHLVRFIEPALPKPITKSMLVKVIGASFLLASSGIAFAYFIMIPLSLHFFAGYSSAEIKPLISANEYLTYVINNFLMFAVAFQIPLLVLFINWITPLKPGKLLKYQRHVIVGAFGIALVLPFTYDPASQFIVALPIIALYYVSIVLLVIANRKKKASYKHAVQPQSKRSTPKVPAPAYGPPTPRPVSLTPVLQPLRSMDGFVMNSSPHMPIRLVSKRALVQPEHRPTFQPSYRPLLAIDGVSQFGH